MVDILSGWTQLAIVWNKTASRVIERIRETEKTLPFSIKGLDFDNGKTFLNYEMLALRHEREGSKRRRTDKRAGSAFITPHVKSKLFQI